MKIITEPTFAVPIEDFETWWERLETKEETQPIIYQFDGTDFSFLSNFYNFKIEIDDIVYATSEHYYQAMKPVEGSVDDKGQLWSEKIRLSKTPAITKRLGRKCPLRPDWEEEKFRFMKLALIAKFRDTELESKLLATGNAYIIEGNTWHDNCFGICIRKDCPRGCGKVKGQNKLGQFLMELRAMLKRFNEEDARINSM